MLKSIPEAFPEVRYQHCTVHFRRNIFTVTSGTKMQTFAMKPKAIPAQEKTNHTSGQFFGHSRQQGQVSTHPSGTCPCLHITIAGRRIYLAFFLFLKAATAAAAASPIAPA